MVQYKIFKKQIRSFEDYIVANFGRVLGEFNMLNYTEKIWGLDCKNIHPDWAKQRITGLKLHTVLVDAIFGWLNDRSPKSLVNQFYYPESGTGQIYQTMAEKIIANGSKIVESSYPEKIIHKDKNIIRVNLNWQGQKRVIRPKNLVSSIPITKLVQLLYPKPPHRVVKAASKLEWRSQVYLFITIDKERVGNDQWLYFPDRDIPFGRVSEMKNFSNSMSPQGKTSLFIEFFVDKEDAVWSMKDREVFDLAMSYLQQMEFCQKQEIISYYVFKKEYVYPVYDLNYPENIQVVKDYLNQFDNLFYIGRPGRFKYTNQDHSLEMGIAAAESILQHQRLNLDNIGSDDEYFEKGDIK